MDEQMKELIRQVLREDLKLEVVRPESWDMETGPPELVILINGTHVASIECKKILKGAVDD